MEERKKDEENTREHPACFYACRNVHITSFFTKKCTVQMKPPSSYSAEAPGSCSDEPTGPPAAVYTRADPAMDPETRDSWTYHSPNRGPTEPRGPGPSKQPPGVSQHTPKHPAPDSKNHKYTGGQRRQPPAGCMARRKYHPHLMGP
ncbi:hypothetical protein AMECASPLE_034942 [Ameca splendens]|uniref:Uncharacterized protein n=1 Tax=Ameca splendens TaxID=208324 RepID=A0ABV0ZT34_9TELE